MKKILARLIWIPLGLALVVFLVANRAPVAISLDPLSADDPSIATPPLPLWLWLTLALLIGFFLGAAGMWASARPARLKAKADRRELANLKQEAARAAAPPGTAPSLEVRDLESAV